MKKTFKDLFKLATALATIAGIAYVARDQIKAIIDKIKEVSGDDIDRLVKSNSILGTNEFVYISGIGGKIMCELTDKKLANIDSMTIELCDTGNTAINFTEMKFNIENIRLLNSLKCSNIQWKLHTKYNCIVSVSKIDDCVGYFSIAALV